MDKLPRPVYDAKPEWIELYNTAWQMAFNNLEYPEKTGWLPQMSCMPGSGKIWQWDSCLMAIYAKYGNGVMPPMNNLDNLYRLQSEDGYISMTYDIDTEKESYGQRINPPLYAWIEWEYFRYSGDIERIRRIYPVLRKYYEWLKGNRRRINGLYYFEDTGSSGMDNSPRSAYSAERLAGSDVCFVDLSSQQALSARYLGEMALLLNHPDDCTYYHREFSDLQRLINHYHWCENKGFYYDVFTRSSPELRHNFLSCKTVAAFWPILAGLTNLEQLESLIDHLQNHEEFNTLHPVPTLSKDDPNYDINGGYWLGAVWAPTNYMVVRGLRNSGKHKYAAEITAKHLDAMYAVWKNPEYSSIWECYAPESFKPATQSKYHNQFVRKNFVGWSGLGPIAMLIENILGFDFDAVRNIITWRPTMHCRNGIENFNFKDGVVSLIASNNEIHIESTSAFSLILPKQNLCYDIKPGSSCFQLVK